MSERPVRCAIYTRKSSEEGLEQSFNSIEAQREACQAFILSQKHEGWVVLNSRYDDGGFSGASMERPGLEQLLRDVKDGKIDTVVVYKVDRLTRSLLDFAKIIQILDSAHASFVSVTQQFNTTSSMGRLTLNVLLSFAQFEREITGERIRDKIAASKKKGMWMGGFVPLGYDCVDHRLIINPREAATVRVIFRQYLRLGCVRKLQRYLDQSNIRSKVRIGAGGKTSGGARFSRGALYHLLRNEVYIGRITHRKASYMGQHRPIVSTRLWERVAARLKANHQGRRNGSRRPPTGSLLSGILFDNTGIRFTPTHSLKCGKRYRYYTSQSVIRGTQVQPQIRRFPAHPFEQFIRSQIHRLLEQQTPCTVGLKHGPEAELIQEKARVLAGQWITVTIAEQDEFLRNILKRVVVGPTSVSIEINRLKLLGELIGQSSPPPVPTSAMVLRIDGRFPVQRRAGALQTILPGQDLAGTAGVSSVARAVVHARDWHQRIISGEVRTIKQISRQNGLSRTYIKKVMRCVSLSPKVADALLTGKQDHRNLQMLLRNVPLSWAEQERAILKTVSFNRECLFF